jgi:hypothetical protein
MSDEQAREPSEEELRAAWEEQLRNLTPADLIVQCAVSLINLGGRRLGLDPGAAGERDLEQARDAIDGVRALLPLLERREDAQTLAPLREALSALQLEFSKLAGPGGPRSGVAPPPGGTPTPGGAPASDSEPDPTGPGPAQRSGRLWVPGS